MKKIPIRTCVACRATGEKRQLVRFVRMADGVVGLDTTGKKSGRGAYVCATDECLAKALTGPLERALNVRLDQSSKERLRSEFLQR